MNRVITNVEFSDWQALQDLNLAQIPVDLVKQEVLNFPSSWRSLLVSIVDPAERFRFAELLLHGTREIEAENVSFEEDLQGRFKRASAEANKVVCAIGMNLPVQELFELIFQKVPDMMIFVDAMAITGREKKGKELEKKRLVLILLSAIGKVRSKRSSALANLLSMVWDGLSCSERAKSVLSKLGLSLSPNKVVEKRTLAIEAERKTIRRLMSSQNASLDFVICFDNLDFRRKVARMRNDEYHLIASTLIAMTKRPPAASSSTRPFHGPQLPELSILFIDNAGFARLEEGVSEEIKRFLIPIIENPNAIEVKISPSSLPNCPQTVQEMHMMETRDLDESKAADMMEWWLWIEDKTTCKSKRFKKDKDDREYAEVWHLPCDAKSFDAILKLRECIQPDSAPDDKRIRPCIGLFHFYWKVFVVSIWKANADLLVTYATKVYPEGGYKRKSLPYMEDPSKEYNTTSRALDAAFPPLLLRLWNYFCSDNPEILQHPLKEQTALFHAWISVVVSQLPQEGVVFEYQRLCRFVHYCCMYKRLKSAIRSVNTAVIEDILHWSMSIVHDNHFIVYRKVVTETVASFHTLSPLEKHRLCQALVINIGGSAFGGKAADRVQEFNNKKLKENARNLPEFDASCLPLISLAGAVRNDHMEWFSGAFSPLLPTTGYRSENTYPKSVIEESASSRFPNLDACVPESYARLQKPFLRVGKKLLDSVCGTLSLLGRQKQFQTLEADF